MKFKSRANQVSLIYRDGIPYVLKVYSSLNLKDRAKDNMLRLHSDIDIPKLISLKGSAIVMEYIEGITMLEHYEKAKREECSDLALQLIDYVMNLYALGYVQRDTNFSNYLLGINGKLYGVDLDEVHLIDDSYTLEDSLSDIVMYALTYDGIDEVNKVAFCSHFMRHIPSYSYIEKAIKRLETRRDKPLIKGIIDLLRKL